MSGETENGSRKQTRFWILLCCSHGLDVSKSLQGSSMGPCQMLSFICYLLILLNGYLIEYCFRLLQGQLMRSMTVAQLVERMTHVKRP